MNSNFKWHLIEKTTEECGFYVSSSSSSKKKKKKEEEEEEEEEKYRKGINNMNITASSIKDLNFHWLLWAWLNFLVLVFHFVMLNKL